MYTIYCFETVLSNALFHLLINILLVKRLLVNIHHWSTGCSKSGSSRCLNSHLACWQRQGIVPDSALRVGKTARFHSKTGKGMRPNPSRGALRIQKGTGVQSTPQLWQQHNNKHTYRWMATIWGMVIYISNVNDNCSRIAQTERLTCHISYFN